jgi:FlgD Ig-like domain/FG-GAP-like repeat
MKKISLFMVLILTLFPFVWLAAQQNSIEELKHNPNFEVKINADSTAEIYNKRTNLRWMKSIKNYTEPENARDADLIIDLDTLNLVYWANLYYQWGEFDAANSWLDAKFIVTDANKNGKNEIYAIQVYENFPEFVFNGNLYENEVDSLFAFQAELYDTIIPVYDIGDITNDGLLDVVCRGFENQLRVFKQDSSNGYIDKFDFIYHPFPAVFQPNDVTFYDLDNDGVQEIIYYLDAGGDTVWSYSNHVARYNPEINNYELIYYHRPTPNWFTFGFATGDFDSDGKNNFSTGSIDGNYFIYEYVSGDDVNVEYQMQLETVNAFLSVMSEDMNGNGKNEIWVGSDFSSSLYGGVTRVFVLEPAGNGSYDLVYQIDIRGLFSGIYGRIRYVDVDGDGIKEIFLNNGTLVFCFKYSPQRNFYLDFIIDTFDYSSDEYDGTDVTDLDSDGTPEFIMQKHNPGYHYQSIFWRRDKTVDVKEINNSIPDEFNLYQNYPNPFNPSTTIRFSIPQEAKVNIKVYDVLGKEITQLLNETRRSGEYEISWNGTDSKGNLVPSGIYFITMFANPGLPGEADSFQKTIKAMLIK